MAISSVLDDAKIRRFRDSLRGQLIQPADAGYDEARRVWNGMIDRRPALIARCAEVADVQQAVLFARAHDLAVAVRGGGHNAAGLAVCDGGVVIDLSPLRTVQVDAERRVARAQGGATWADFDAATAAHGLATTGGAISTTGIAGLTLGGGLGWLMRRHGLACDNLLSAELVTADGELAVASDAERADLFWGVRGGGGNFGIVTAFQFRLHPLTQVVGGMLVHPLSRAQEVLRFYREFTAAAPDELIVFAGLMITPDGTPAVGLVACYAGPPEEGERVIRPLREFGPPAVDQIGPLPYTALQRMLDEAFPPGLQVYWRSEFLDSLGDEVIEVALQQFLAAPSPLTMVLIEQFGGAVARVPRDATAFDHRDAAYNLVIVGRWADPAQAEPNIAWARGMSESVRPYGRGVYVNYIGVGEGEERVKAAYGAEKYARLVALKDAYDPTNVFQLNQNIRPTGGAQ